MRWTIRLECEDSDESVVIGHIDRQDALQAAAFGVTLVESKQILTGLQSAVVQRQFIAHADAQRACSICGHRRHIKDYHAAQFQTLFGDITLRVPRFRHCDCTSENSAVNRVTVEGLTDWVSPELWYVQNELAATLPYARTSALMQLLLPVGRGASRETVRRRIQTTAARLDSELNPLPAPSSEPTAAHESSNESTSSATVIGLDSGYVRHCRPRSERSFEIVAGRILSSESQQRSVGFVRTLENNVEARRRLQRRMNDLGAPGETLTVFSDGDAGLRHLVPGAVHVLDWFHLTRYLTVIKEVLFGRDTSNQFPAVIHDRLCNWLTSMKWRLWHGRVNGALQRLESMRFILQRDAVTRKPATARLRRQLDKLQSYLTSNADSIPNYGKRYRRGERISTAFVESAVNQLIDKRMSKSQQMRWSPKGAYAVLQVRAEVVDQRLRANFARWYPGFTAANDSTQIAA